MQNSQVDDDDGALGSGINNNSYSNEDFPYNEVLIASGSLLTHV